ncbi:MAG: MFS transporter, partial [Candidatus Bathyarchaeia archaeon]
MTTPGIDGDASSALPNSRMSIREGGGLVARLASEFSFIRGNFLLLILSWLIMDFAGELPGTYYPLYVEALGGTAATVGVIGFVSQLSKALVQFPGGYLADKYGRRWLISTMTFGVAVSYAFYAFAPNWQVIMLGAVIHNLCLIYSPALNAVVMDSLPPERRGMGFSIVNLITSASTTPAPLIAGWLYTRLGLVPSMRMSYIFVVVAFLIAAVLRLGLKETVKSPGRIDGRELLSTFPSSIVESLRVWRVVPRSAFVLFLTGGITMFSIALFQPVLLFWIVYDLGISRVGWSILLTVLFISMIVLAIPCGKLIDRVGKKGPLLLGYLLFLLMVPMFIYGDFYRLLIAMTLVGLLMILLNAASTALNADLVPREHRGKVAGSSSFFN